MRKLRGRQQTPSDHNADQVAAGLLLVQEDSGTDLDALLVLLDTCSMPSLTCYKSALVGSSRSSVSHRSHKPSSTPWNASNAVMAF